MLHPAGRGVTVVLAIDPGSEQSAWLVYNPVTRGIRSFAIDSNAELVALLRPGLSSDIDAVAIERIESYGMAVGREVFDTVWWAGRFAEAVRPVPVYQVPRREVKLAICGDTRAKDANIRSALLDLFGGQAAAVGRKATPGPLYGISRDVWSALAIAVTFAGRLPVDA